MCAHAHAEKRRGKMYAKSCSSAFIVLANSESSFEEKTVHFRLGVLNGANITYKYTLRFFLKNVYASRG